MKTRNIIRASLVALLLVGIAGYILYATVFMSRPDPTERCEDVELTVECDSKAQFIDKRDVENILRKDSLYPVGLLMTDIHSRDIEEAISRNAFVEKVECYKSAKGKMCIKVKQRKPVIYVMPDGSEGYFVDATGKIIPNTHYAENLPTATGRIDEAFASTQLMEFGLYLQEDEFWNNQIEQIYVISAKGKHPQIELIPRVGDHVIEFGSLDDYEGKLKRLKTFYQKAMGTVGWNKYERISCEYDRQIIGTKKK